MNTKVLCCYHKGCLDGLFASAVVALKFGIENVEFIALEYHDPIPNFTGRQVYIVDFSYPPEVLLPAIATAQSVIMLDHHAGAMNKWKLDWEANPEWAGIKNFVPIFDTNKAGCVLAWDFFFGTETCDPQPVPLILQRVQDYDLWQHKWECSHELQAGMIANGFLEEDRNIILHDLLKIDDSDILDDIQELINLGRTVLEAEKRLAKAIIARNTKIVTFATYEVPFCNCPYELRNIVGEMLYKDHAFSITYEDRNAEGVRKFSFRSDRVHGINLLELPQRWNISGHPNAAGCTVNLKDTWHAVFNNEGEKLV